MVNHEYSLMEKPVIHEPKYLSRYELGLQTNVFDISSILEG